MVIIKNKERLPHLIVIASITILFIVVAILMVFRLQSRKEEYFEISIEDYNSQIDATLESYSRFSEYIYNDVVVEDDYILNLVSEAFSADEDTQDAYRDDLYNYLIDEYEFMKEYDFRQFHFHFPDSTSFLRLHKPSKYGDSLYDVRYSLRTVNDLQTIQTGFEEGRIFNGYRYVYPLNYNNEHIGSVEISISLSSVINVLSGLYNYDYCFIMSKDVVDSIVFDDETTNYTESFISEDFYIDNDSFAHSIKRNLIPQAEFEDFFASVDPNDLEGLKDFNDLGFTTEYEDERYEVLFSSIENIEGIKVGYFISISEEEGFKEIIKSFITDITILIGLYILFLVSGIIFVKNRGQLKELSNTDRLTSLDNRRKFEKDVNKEIYRSMRSKAPLSFIMFDIDHFKVINDTYGHRIGDMVLRELSLLTRSLIRREDCLSRYGGEEFIIMMIDSNEIDAYNKAENLRKVVEQFKFSFDGNVNISLGVYEYVDTEDEYEIIIDKVDKAMYCAKELGRNKTVKYSNIKTP